MRKGQCEEFLAVATTDATTTQEPVPERAAKEDLARSRKSSAISTCDLASARYAHKPDAAASELILHAHATRFAVNTQDGALLALANVLKALALTACARAMPSTEPTRRPWS